MRQISLLAAIAASILALPVVCFGQEPEALAGSEQQAMADTFQYALENNPVNETSDWVNPDSGNAGTVTPVQTYEDAAGQPCREFVTTIIIGGREEQGYGTACRQPDGSWQVVPPQDNASETRQPAAAQIQPMETSTTVWYDYPVNYYYGYPAGYYRYPAGFYGSSNIFFSFSYVYRNGHRYPGTWYLDGRSFRHRHPVGVQKRIYNGPRIYNRHNWYYRGPVYRQWHGNDRFREFRGNHDRRGDRPNVWRDPGHGGHQNRHR
jgi:surface antigen